MLERQREEIAKAKGEGKYKGRKPTARAKAGDIRRLASEGATREAIAARTSRSASHPSTAHCERPRPVRLYAARLVQRMIEVER